MSKNDFINELKKRLRKLPYDEIKEAVDYYNEYFDDAGEENEQTVLAELGSASAIAAQIIASSAIKGADTENSVKKSWNTAWLVILSLLASPVAVPVAIAVGIVALAIIIVLSAVVFAFFASGVSLVVGGVMYIITGILVIAQSPSTTLFILGVGLIALGAGAAIIMGTAALSKICFNWLTKKVGSFIIGRNAK